MGRRGAGRAGALSSERAVAWAIAVGEKTVETDTEWKRQTARRISVRSWIAPVQWSKRLYAPRRRPLRLEWSVFPSLERVRGGWGGRGVRMDGITGGREGGMGQNADRHAIW